MSNSRLRCWIIAVGIFFLTIFILITLVYLIHRPKGPPSKFGRCPRPEVFSTNYDYDYQRQKHEFQNLDGSVDYFRLALSWSPTFCESKSHKQRKEIFQCRYPFEFIVHGLWPNSRSKNQHSSNRIHPRNCRNEEMIPLEIINKYFCLMPSENLMQAEWEKHGTCSWSTANDYFSKIGELYSAINLPNNLQSILSESNLSNDELYQKIQRQFMKLNPQLKKENFHIQMTGKGNKLREVAFCYDLSFNLTSC